jgi:predicted nucleotidyltransferase
MPKDIKEIQEKIAPLLKEAGVLKAAIFGSVARGESNADSDVDLFIELKQPLGLLKFARLNYMLEDVLQRKVDLVKNTAIKPAFKSNIMRDAIYIYGK